MCDCLAIFGRILIGILSLIFAIIGFGMLVVGIIVKVNVDTLSQVTDPLVQAAKSQAESAVGNNIDLPTDNFGPLLEDLLGGLGIAFIVLGSVMLVVGVFGVAGACCMVKCMIIGYLICMTILTLGALTLVIILVVDKAIILTPAKTELTKTVKQEYQGLNGTSVTSSLWNVIMSWQQCCGVNDYKDFDSTSAWYPLFGPSSSYNYQIPAACCKAGKYSPPSTTCTLTASPDNNKDVGCFDKLMDFLLEGAVFIGFSAGTVSFLALLTFFAAVILYKIVKKNKVQPFQ